MGLQRDLRLTDNQPNVALAIFFIPYVLFEIPSNILLKRLSPRIWRGYRLLSIERARLIALVSGCTVAFGVAMLAQGFGTYPFECSNNVNMVQ
jgi:hypothetical protein